MQARQWLCSCAENEKWPVAAEFETSHRLTRNENPVDFLSAHFFPLPHLSVSHPQWNAFTAAHTIESTTVVDA
jgi:hypothetical protein